MTQRPPQSDAARVLMVGLPDTRLDPKTTRRLHRLAPGGIILFGRNLDTPSQTVGLIEAAGAAVPDPALFALDQEGGQVSRLEPWIGPTPTAVQLARLGVPAATDFGRSTARVMRHLGFNLDFAPVVDLSAPDAANGIGPRAFSEDPAIVNRLAGAFLEGLQSGGVAGCLKHFPGLGPTRVDSHLALPVVERSAAELEARDLVPFHTLGPGAACVMVGHGHYPAFDGRAARPATGSAAVIEELLRRRLGYSGLVVSDDLEMGAVGSLDVEGRFAVDSIAAGCDLLLYCSDLDRAERAARALSERADADPGFRRRLGEAAAAVRRTAGAWPAPEPDLSGWDAAAAAMRGFTPDRTR